MKKQSNSFYSLLDTQERLEKEDNESKNHYQTNSYLDVIDTQTKQLLFCYLVPILLTLLFIIY